MSVRKRAGRILGDLIYCRRIRYLNDKISVIPAFVAEKDDLKALEIARSWSNQQYWDFGTWHPGNQGTEVAMSNIPRSYTVFKTEHRAGKTVFKVFDDQGYCFDMRDDVVIDTMLEVGVEAGGRLGGEYIWGKLASQTRLVRVGSDLYQELL